MISFRSEHEEKEVTISVDDGQTIGRTITVLRETGIFHTKAQIVRSMMTKERTAIANTYKDSHIFNGDILMFE